MNNLSILKALKTKLLNKQCKDEYEFEIIQDKLNEVEMRINLEKTRTEKS